MNAPLSPALWPACLQGGTQFIPLTEALASLAPKQRQRLERVSLRIPGKTNSGEKLLHPLLYSHPRTGDPVLCLNLGK